MSDGNTARALTVSSGLRRVFGKLRRRLREETPAGDLSWSQIHILNLLDREGPATVTALARAEGVRPQSMGATTSGLEAAGLLTSAPDPTDGRQAILSLTPAGLEVINAGRAARDDWMSRAIQTRLSASEQEELARAIELLQRIVDE